MDHYVQSEVDNEDCG